MDVVAKLLSSRQLIPNERSDYGDIQRIVMQYPERLQLANLPTPIQFLKKTSQQVGKQIYIWRDDLTDFIGSGNKIRKLEFLLADAVARKATTVITCGGIQSNHARATAYLAKRLGLEVHLILRLPQEHYDRHKPAGGNLLLSRIYADHIRYIDFAEYAQRGHEYDAFLVEEAEKLRAKGKQPYLIPEGGSSPLGVFGYFHAAEEMITTWIGGQFGGDAPDAVFFALGSGGTHAGLHLGFEKMGISTDSLYAVNVCDNREYFELRVLKLIADTCEKYGFDSRERRLQIFDGHVGGGYGVATEEELRSYYQLAHNDGILLDPCYTGKAFRGMLAEIKKNPQRFGERILFLHSGGSFATYNFIEAYNKVIPQ